MATSLFREPLDDVPTTYDAARYTSPSGYKAAVNEIRLTNKTTGSIVVDVELYPLGSSANNLVLVKSTTMPGRRTYAYRGFRSLLATDELHVKSNTANALDLLVNGLEQNSSVSVIHQGWLQSVSSTTYQTLFTGPTNDCSINDLTCTNKSTAAVTVSIELWPLGSSTGSVVLADTQSIAKYGRYEHIGMINVQNTDTIKITASSGSAIDAVCSAVE